ncbi:hypothetical protein L596_006860 [Steinernema carpocapsae]|uniref:ShKT domain-containing protein n=1 Tax=Steinernema carpocapsae TaxID=34508 RepID=A0A4U5P760_STECR|nr:hypothetical protein L596_006860 [Steinernema carpocapsae]
MPRLHLSQHEAPIQVFLYKLAARPLSIIHPAMLRPLFFVFLLVGVANAGDCPGKPGYTKDSTKKCPTKKATECQGLTDPICVDTVCCVKSALSPRIRSAPASAKKEEQQCDTSKECTGDPDCATGITAPTGKTPKCEEDKKAAPKKHCCWMQEVAEPSAKPAPKKKGPPKPPGDFQCPNDGLFGQQCINSQCPDKTGTCYEGWCCYSREGQAVPVTTTTRIPSIAPQPQPSPSPPRRTTRRPSGNCRDHSPDCIGKDYLCQNKIYRDLMVHQCARTCNLCHLVGTVVLPPAPSPRKSLNCVDANLNCPMWVQNGFCSNSFYSTDIRRRMCGSSCGLC